MGGGGSEHVAPGEGRARAPAAGTSGLVSSTAAVGAAAHRDRAGEQPVVGTDEVALPVADLDGDGPAGGADAGVDDGEHHAGAQVLRGAAEVSDPARTS